MKRDEDQVIEDIITAFQGYALSDIKFNKDRPIAAAILSACLFDQMSAFFFRKGKPTDKARRFIEKYMPKYKDIKLYDILRNSLVHNYSLNKNYSVSSDPNLNQYDLSILPNGIIFIPLFVSDLEIAIEKAVKDLRENDEIKKLAVEWEKSYNVLRISQSNLGIYSKEEIRRLRSDYLPLLLNHKIIVNDKVELNLYAEFISSDNFVAYIEAKGPEDQVPQKYNLEGFAEILGIISPLKYLES